MQDHDWKEFVNEILNAKHENYNHDHIAKTAFALLSKHAPQYLTSCKDYFESAALNTQNLSLFNKVRDYYEVKDEGKDFNQEWLGSQQIFFDFTSSEIKALNSLVNLIKTTLNTQDQSINILRQSFRSWFSDREDEQGFHFKLEVKGKTIHLELSKITEELLYVVFDRIKRDFKGRQFNINIVSMNAQEEENHKRIFDNFIKSSKNKYGVTDKKQIEHPSDSTSYTRPSIK